MTEEEPYRLVFVCTANICRSPMAEGLARHYAQQRRWNVEVRSAGIMGLIGEPASPLAVRVLGEVGIDISGHQSSGIDDELLDWADYILTAEFKHSLFIRDRFPEREPNILQLANFAGKLEIADPIGGWRWRFRSCRDTLSICVQSFMDRLPPRPLPPTLVGHGPNG